MKGKAVMFILYWKEFHIVKEPLRKNCTCQTWRGKQVAMCDTKEPLEEYIKQQPEQYQRQYYIEERKHQSILTLE